VFWFSVNMRVNLIEEAAWPTERPPPTMFARTPHNDVDRGVRLAAASDPRGNGGGSLVPLPQSTGRLSQMGWLRFKNAHRHVATISSPFSPIPGHGPVS
jgi:hypothetical protein